ncbi:MAG TPA: peptidase [Allosphingosinicella sp.]|nr:peptidase [Allosphingosinicella sp.]
MTYCLGMLLDAGLIMIADTRTNAGVDDFSTYRKLHCLIDEADRCIYAASAGNLSTTQTIISLLREGLPTDDEGNLTRTIAQPTSMFRAAQLVGEAVQLANQTVGRALASINIRGTSSLLLGGRVGDAPPSLYLIYSAGNFIECKPDVPFFQIGEHKYGRPILDRTIDLSTPLSEAMKLAFLSFDASIRSNLAIGRPLDVVVMPSGGGATLNRRVEEDDPYFNDLSARWGDLLHHATAAIPDPPFMAELDGPPPNDRRRRL